MKCPNCGKEITDDSKFCEYCGTKVVKENKVWIKNKIYLTLFLAISVPSLLVALYCFPVYWLSIYAIILLIAPVLLYTSKKISLQYAITCCGIICLVIVGSYLGARYFWSPIYLKTPLIACVIGFLGYHLIYSKDDKIINS